MEVVVSIFNFIWHSQAWVFADPTPHKMYSETSKISQALYQLVQINAWTHLTLFANKAQQLQIRTDISFHLLRSPLGPHLIPIKWTSDFSLLHTSTYVWHVQNRIKPPIMNQRIVTSQIASPSGGDRKPGLVETCLHCGSWLSFPLWTPQQQADNSR